MHRRHFIKNTAIVSLLASTGTLSGCTTSQPLSIWLEQTINRLESLKQKNLTFDGPWQGYATFSHLAQSIEFSLVGFPEHKSDGFKNWVGKPAFNVFKAMSSMSHDTAEPIPGADELDHKKVGSTDIDKSIERLIQALTSFQTSQTLFPHFAYGALSHDDYLVAHILHIEDHLNLLA